MSNPRPGSPPSDQPKVHVVTDLGTLPGTANAINNAGQIVGSGTHNGASRAFLLTPVSNVESPASTTGGATNE